MTIEFDKYKVYLFKRKFSINVNENNCIVLNHLNIYYSYKMHGDVYILIRVTLLVIWRLSGNIPIIFTKSVMILIWRNLVLSVRFVLFNALENSNNTII